MVSSVPTFATTAAISKMIYRNFSGTVKLGWESGTGLGYDASLPLCQTSQGLEEGEQGLDRIHQVQVIHAVPEGDKAIPTRSLPLGKAGLELMPA